MASSGMILRVALVRTGVSEEFSAFFIRVTRIGELGTTPAVTSNRRTLRTNTKKTAVFDPTQYYHYNEYYRMPVDAKGKVKISTQERTML
jgi:hypothetical protein